MYDDLPTLTKEEWISVLKLSTNWLFNDMRQLAISNLSLPFPSLGLITDPIERICLAKEYRVYDWLVEGYEKVIDRLITSDDDHGSPLTLTLQEGQRIGLDVALELSGIAIRRMRLAERRVPLKDMRCDVLDAFKQEFDCVREEGSRFIKKEQRLEEEAREKAKAAPEESHKKMEESKNISRSEKTDQKAEELDKRKGAEKPTPSPDSGLSKKVKVKHRKLKREDHEKAKQIGPDGKDTKPLAVEKTVGLKDGEGSAQEDAGRLDNENTKRLEEEEMRTLKEEIAKRRKEEEKLRVKQIWKQWDEAEERKVQALAEEEMRRRRMGPTEENAKAESSKIMPFPEKPKFLSWCE
ncbi:hypothetical protein BKA70DRAFT_1199858 [Coprinopsis sp. MPI-PUGE-AT-0042]|nr:hypothetical protein BKA70DRAFT_1199858 [Coprinopsis sp. MPI-PUGE-AT-0042]